jgi:hypothetical protein
MFKFIFLLLVSFTCLADELSVDINLTAHHWNRTDVAEQHLNEFNPGIGLHWTDGDYHKLIGVYKNSDSNWSTYALLAWTPIKLGAITIAHFNSIDIGPMAGMVTGYSSPYKPAAGLYAAINLTDHTNLNITAVPTIRSIQCYGFAGFQLSFKF